MRLAVPLALPLSLFLYCVPARTQPAAAPGRAEVEALIVKGHSEREAGRLSDAIEYYRQAQAKALEAKLPTVEGDAWILIADTLDMLAAAESPALRAVYLLSATEAYRNAISLGLPPAQDALARNNCAFVYVHLGNTEEARRWFDGILFDELDPPSRARYRTNYANVERNAGNLAAAYQNYLLAVRASPSFARAVNGAFLLINDSRSRMGSAEAAEILDILVQNYQTNLAKSYAFQFLLGRRKNAEPVLDCLLRAWAANPPVPPRVAASSEVQEEIASLRKVEEVYEDYQPVVAKLAAELVGVLEDAWPVPESEGGAVRPVKYWSGRLSARTALVALLRSCAHAFAHPPSSPDGAPRAAFEKDAVARYIAAWYLNRTDTESALAAAALISRNQVLDPNGRMSSRLSSYYTGESVTDILARGLLDTDPGRRNLQLGAGDFVNIALMHIALSAKGGIAELERARDALDRANASRGGTATAEIYKSLAIQFQEKKVPLEAARMYWSAAAAYQESGDTAQAIEAVASALSGLPALAQEARLIQPYEGMKEVLVYLPRPVPAASLRASVRVKDKMINVPVSAAGTDQFYLLHPENPLPRSSTLSVALPGSTRLLEESVRHRNQREAGAEVAFNDLLPGDRFLSGEVPAQTQRLMLRVYDRPGVSDDHFAQSALASIDPANSSFFAPLHQPLHSYQHVVAHVVPLSGESPKDTHADVNIIPTLSRFGLYVMGGGLVTRSGDFIGSRLGWRIFGEYSARSWVQEAAWPISGVLTQVAHAQFHSFRWGLRLFGSFGSTTLVSAAGPSDRKVRIDYVRESDLGAYAPLLFNNLTWRYWNHAYVPFISPLVAARSRLDSYAEKNSFIEYGFRCGVLRSPMTLRHVEPELGSHFDLIRQNSDSYRYLPDQPSVRRPQYQWQLRAKVPIYPTPFLVGFTKTMGPWPRDFRLFMGMKLDVLSLARLFKGPVPRTF